MTGNGAIKISISKSFDEKYTAIHLELFYLNNFNSLNIQGVRDTIKKYRDIVFTDKSLTNFELDKAEFRGGTTKSMINEDIAVLVSTGNNNTGLNRKVETLELTYVLDGNK